MSNTETSSKKVIWISSLAIIFVLVFCAGFVAFYTRNDRNKVAPEPVSSGNSLPAAELVDESSQVLPESQLKNGKVVLVFVTAECDACMKESAFLKDLVSKRPDIRFYGVVSFGDEKSLGEAQGKFPFQVFYDRGLKLRGQLGIDRVPIKVFVENGIMKKSWGGATIDEKKKAAFIRWLEEV
ncbi:MAG TPA: redoxin family protein [Pyrinomonadaceae bacterium]